MRVLDFVGNYKGAELRPLFLTGNYKKGKGVINTTDKEFLLPEGCSAEFNFKLIEYFEKFKRKSIRQEELVKLDYKNLMETLERVPTLMDTYTFGEIPVHMYIKTFKCFPQYRDRVVEIFQTSDVRAGREDEKWFNIFFEK